MADYNLEIKDSSVFINDEKIKESIFEQEKIDYKVEDREDFIDKLITWVSEATSDKEMMKNDLKYLMSCKDSVIFSSISTNEYVLKEDNLKGFNEICTEILELNKEVD